MIQQLLSPLVGRMSPYAPIEPPDQIAQRLGLPEEQIIKLDANENPFGTAPKVLEALSQGKYYHIYPDPAQVALRRAIAAYAQVPMEQVVAGTGADELIDLTCRLLLQRGDKVLAFTPTFGYYSHVVDLNSGVYVTAPREADFSISLKKAQALDLSGVKLVALCSPNNPSGNLVEPEVLDYFLAQNLVVLLDEAYYEFSGVSQIQRVMEHPNLIVLRTFSKCFALAGFRVGYGVMGVELAQAMMKIKPPYSVSVPAEESLKAALADLPHFQGQVAELIEIRQECQARLADFKALTPYPSQSNFILCRVEGYSAKQLKLDLENRGILVRYFETAELNNFIRVSMGRRDQMAKLYQALTEILG
ncbi:MAG: histidinol-phosphate transaminase [bacterium]|nr:histidinol-phosphate transaminase [bacterium]